MRSLHFLIWVFLYCRNVFSLLLKIIFSRSVKVGSSSFCCRDALVLAISVWRWLILIFVHLILLYMSEHSAFFIMACSNLWPIHFICKVFGVTLFARHLTLKFLAVHLVFQHKRQLTLHTFLISIYNRSVIPMFAPFKL